MSQLRVRGGSNVCSRSPDRWDGRAAVDLVDIHDDVVFGVQDRFCLGLDLATDAQNGCRKSSAARPRRDGDEGAAAEGEADGSPRRKDVGVDLQSQLRR